MMNIRRYCILLLTLTLGACIRNDIPYPVVSIDILSVQGEGFTCESSDIDTKNRIVTLHLDETTDISRVPISEITITEGGRSSIPLSGEFDLRADLSVVLSLYQDYDWTLRADQPIERFFTVESQIGAAEFDPDKRIARAYVPTGTDMQHIRITRLKLGPKDITTMTPAAEELTSFETFRSVEIKYHDFTEQWMLYVVPTEVTVQFTQTDAWSRIIWLYAEGRSGAALGFRYRKQGDAQWIEVPSDKIQVSGGAFHTRIAGLEPETAYEVVAVSGRRPLAGNDADDRSRSRTDRRRVRRMVHGKRHRLPGSDQGRGLLGHGQYGRRHCRHDADRQSRRNAAGQPRGNTPPGSNRNSSASPE